MSIDEADEQLSHKPGLPAPERLFEMSHEWSQRFTLSLALGNGAGLAVALTALSDPTRTQFWPLAIASAWLFFIGVSAAGILPLIHATEIMMLQKSQSIAKEFEKAPLGLPVLGQKVVLKVYDLMVVLKIWCRWLGGGAFVLAMVSPLLARTASLIFAAF